MTSLTVLPVIDEMYSISTLPSDESDITRPSELLPACVLSTFSSSAYLFFQPSGRTRSLIFSILSASTRAFFFSLSSHVTAPYDLLFRKMFPLTIDPENSNGSSSSSSLFSADVPLLAAAAISSGISNDLSEEPFSSSSV